MEDGILVDVRSSGAAPPFWLLHPIGGNVLFARHLLRQLPAHIPIIGIQARGLDGRRAPFDSIPEAAEFYLQLIRSRQPQGPYFLGGPSFGGNLAYEMASRLAISGARVGLLALLDAFGPGYPRHRPLRQRVARRLARLWGALGERTASPAVSNGSTAADTLAGPGAALLALRRVMAAHDHALCSYRPGPFPGRVHLLRAASPPDWPGMVFDDPTSGWDGLAQQGLDIISIPGSHQSILDPPWIDGLGKALSQILIESYPVCLGPAPKAELPETR